MSLFYKPNIEVECGYKLASLKGTQHTQFSADLMLILSTYRVVLHPSYHRRVFSLSDL